MRRIKGLARPTKGFAAQTYVPERPTKGLNWRMKTLLMILALGLCLPLVVAEKKKTDVEEAGYKGRVKRVKVSGFVIEEKDGKFVRTQVPFR